VGDWVFVVLGLMAGELVFFFFGLISSHWIVVVSVY
jgi:hypothetical protein